MGAADDEGAAVDPQLRLRGLRNLRVADASIFPLQLGVNPNLTIAMLAERCAAWVLGSAGNQEASPGGKAASDNPST